jgi:hypothetical protein
MTGPQVTVAVPNRASASWLLHSGGDLVEIYLGGERTGGVFLTLRTDQLGTLLDELHALHDNPTPANQSTSDRQNTVGDPDPPTPRDRMLRPPHPHDFATGPNVCIAATGRATITTTRSTDGQFADLLIASAGSPGGGVVLTLPVRGLGFLISELEDVCHGAVNRGGVYPSSRWAPEPPERSTNPTNPFLTGTARQNPPTD